MSPSKFQTLTQEAIRLHQAGRLPAAIAQYTALRRLQPGSFQVLHLGGVALVQQGQNREAIDWLTRALALKPDSAATAMCLGLAQTNLGMRAAAETNLRRSVQLDPKNNEAWTNLAAVLLIANKTEESAEAYRRAIQLKPTDAHAWTGLGSVLLLLGRPAEAVEHHTHALKLDPRHPKARFARAQAYQACNQVSAALADFDAHLAQQPDHHEARSYRLFLLNYLDSLSHEQLLAEHLAFGQALPSAPRRAAAAANNIQDPQRRLRVAFLSPDLRVHSVAYFIEPLLQHLDPAQFEIVLYHDHFCVDAMSERLRARATLWRNFVGQTHDAVEAQIRADRIDVLIDLAGHTGFNRLPLFARRLAPAQITYLGYPNTTGLTAMDFRFTDAIADPVNDSDAWHSERLVRFAPTAWAYSPPHDAPLPAVSTGRPFTFGSFNNVSKITDGTLRLWSDLLRAVPESRLLLKSFGLSASVMQPRLVAAGLDPARVTLVPGTGSVAEHLALYAEMDVALDPFPYHGTTTTCEALWMGVPVVSLRGDRHAARVGASLLNAVGHPEWIADTRADYVRIATELASDPTRLAALRSHLREDLRRSALLDHLGQAHRFGRALRACWQETVGHAGALDALSAPPFSTVVAGPVALV